MALSMAARKRGTVYALAAGAISISGVYLAGLGPSLLATGKYLPHGFCYTWQPNLIGLHLVSDTLIGLAYMSIPLTLLYFIKRRTDLPFNWMFVLFGVFIVACGATHWMEVWTLWFPHYWLAGAVKAVTAAASVPTAILLVMLVPKALAIPSTRQLQEARDALEQQVRERVRAEEALRAAHAMLETRVAQRTAELADANEQLEQQRSQLAEADKRKDRFLAILSHELRNPLHAIATASSLLEKRHGTAATHDLAQQIIKRQVGQLAHLLDDLLDVSRIATGKMQLAVETIDAKTAVLAALDGVKALIEDRRHTLELDMPNESLYVRADSARLEQIVANLLNNAARYTDPGGRITVRLCRHEDEVVLSVRDTGVGIDPGDLPNLFSLFVQGKTTGDRSRAGLGIGLHLARELTRLHGGRITASSPGPDQGSEFIVRLPLQGAPASNASQQDGSAPAAGNRLRVVVVDDNIDAAESLALLLQASGHVTRVAADGPGGVEQILAFEPDVALVDIGLPGFDGYEVARQVRASSRGSDLTLVAITGWGQQTDKTRAKDAGFDHHMTKPVTYEQLETLLAQVRRSGAAA